MPPHDALLPERGLLAQLAHVHFARLGLVHETGAVRESVTLGRGGAQHARREGVDVGGEGLVLGKVVAGGGRGGAGAVVGVMRGMVRWVVGMGVREGGGGR